MIDLRHYGDNELSDMVFNNLQPNRHQRRKAAAIQRKLEKLRSKLIKSLKG